MDCEPVREDIEAYVLGALDAFSTRRLEAHVRTCSSCRDLIRAYGPTVGLIALSAPLQRAPTRLKERVLGGVGAYSATVSPVTLVRSSRWWAAAAVIFLGLGIGAVAWAFVLSAQVNDLRRDNAALAELSQAGAEDRTRILQLQADVNTAKSQQRAMEAVISDQQALIRLALDPDLIPTDMQGTEIAPQAHCRYVWSSSQSMGALNCQNLPSISFALTYQLWMVRGDRTLSMGTFAARPDGTASLLYKPSGEGSGSSLGPITDMFVTLESASSVARQPSQEVLLRRVARESELAAR
ncbi:MAG TPA: anti-sigma factor [Dehalococcoidia bacterium]|nr:anti-sigma factor [Dehalococcoidia bacterium]